MQLNFPVLSMCSCVALENASFMDCRTVFIFLRNKTSSEKMVPRTSLPQTTLSPYSVYKDKIKEKCIILHALNKITDFH